MQIGNWSDSDSQGFDLLGMITILVIDAVCIINNFLIFILHVSRFLRITIETFSSSGIVSFEPNYVSHTGNFPNYCLIYFLPPTVDEDDFRLDGNLDLLP